MSIPVAYEIKFGTILHEKHSVKANTVNKTKADKDIFCLVCFLSFNGCLKKYASTINGNKFFAKDNNASLVIYISFEISDTKPETEITVPMISDRLTKFSLFFRAFTV